MGGGGGYQGDVHSDAVGGKWYTEDNITALKGFCGVVDVARIPQIWDKLKQSKELSSHRHHIRSAMEKWARTLGFEIDKAPFFTEQDKRYCWSPF